MAQHAGKMVHGTQGKIMVNGQKKTKVRKIACENEMTNGHLPNLLGGKSVTDGLLWFMILFLLNIKKEIFIILLVLFFNLEKLYYFGLCQKKIFKFCFESLLEVKKNIKIYK